MKLTQNSGLKLDNKASYGGSLVVKVSESSGNININTNSQLNIRLFNYRFNIF